MQSAGLLGFLLLKNDFVTTIKVTQTESFKYPF